MTTVRDQYFQTLTKTYLTLYLASMSIAFPNAFKLSKRLSSNKTKIIASRTVVPKLSLMQKFPKASASPSHDFFI